MTDFIDRDEMRRRLNKCPSDEITAAFEILDAMPGATSELAALKGRRCETCRWYVALYQELMGCGHCVIVAGESVDPDFACNRWAEREKP